jgi:chromosome condensin MukBEF ATPase and DNA-binding subunit MukB
MREFPQSAKPELLAALADVGVEPDDYALIEQARALVDEVNRRLRARRSQMIYTITFCNAVPLSEPDRPAVLDLPWSD